MKVEQYMTPCPESVSPGTTVRVAIKKMLSSGFRHLLIMDDTRLIGLVSQRELDILTTISSFDPDRASVELAMTPDPFSVDIGEPLSTVARMMAEAKVGSAVVMRGGEPAGIFTTTDALRALAEVSK